MIFLSESLLVLKVFIALSLCENLILKFMILSTIKKIEIIREKF